MRIVALCMAMTFLAASAGCARTAAEPADSGTTQTDVADDHDGGTGDVGGVLRDDGCPSDPRNLPRPCTEIGKRCAYIDECLKTPPSTTATSYECMGSGPYTNSWQPWPVECESFTGPDGCPLAPPKALGCTTPGLRCVYYTYLCSMAGGRIAPYECRATDGGAVWVVLPREDCPAK